MRRPRASRSRIVCRSSSTSRSLAASSSPELFLRCRRRPSRVGCGVLPSAHLAGLLRVYGAPAKTLQETAIHETDSGSSRAVEALVMSPSRARAFRSRWSVAAFAPRAVVGDRRCWCPGGVGPGSSGRSRSISSFLPTVRFGGSAGDTPCCWSTRCTETGGSPWPALHRRSRYRRLLCARPTRG